MRKIFVISFLLAGVSLVDAMEKPKDDKSFSQTDGETQKKLEGMQALCEGVIADFARDRMFFVVQQKLQSKGLTFTQAFEEIEKIKSGKKREPFPEEREAFEAGVDQRWGEVILVEQIHMWEDSSSPFYKTEDMGALDEHVAKNNTDLLRFLYHRYVSGDMSQN